MTKKVTLDKTEYDEMEKEIERLKSINEELVKGASVVIDPHITVTYGETSFSIRHDLPINRWKYYKGIRVSPRECYNENFLETYKELQIKLKEQLDEYFSKQFSELDKEETNLTDRKEWLESEYRIKVKLLGEKEKELEEARPIKRYVLAGVLLTLVGNYVLGLI